MIITSKIYINCEVEILGFETFLEKTFEQFELELISLRKTFFRYKGGSKHLYNMPEKSWMGLFNTAISKALPENIILQHYGREDVINNESANTLVYFQDSHCKEICILFEVIKQEMPLDASIRYLDAINRELITFFEAEQQYFKDINTFIVPMVFSVVKDEELKQAKLFFKNNLMYSSHVSFSFLSYENNCGIWVYGRIYFT